MSDQGSEEHSKGRGSPFRDGARPRAIGPGKRGLGRERIKLLLREVAAETADDPADQQAEHDRIIALLS